MPTDDQAIQMFLENSIFEPEGNNNKNAWTCPFCDLSYMSYDSMKRHVRKKHPEIATSYRNSLTKI